MKNLDIKISFQNSELPVVLEEFKFLYASVEYKENAADITVFQSCWLSSTVDMVDGAKTTFTVQQKKKSYSIYKIR